MDSSTFYLASLLLAATFYVRRVGISLTLGSVLLGLLLLFHGPAYLYYTRSWGLETEFYWQILDAAPGSDVIGSLDIALGITFLSVCAGMFIADVMGGTDAQAHADARRAWAESPMRVPDALPARLRGAAMLGLVLMLAFAVLDHQFAKIAQYATADLGEFEKIALRRELGGSTSYLFNLLQGNVLPFIAFAMVVLYRAKWPDLPVGLFGAFVAMLLIAKLATLSKAPLAVFGVQLVVAATLARSLTVSTGTVVKLLLLATGLFIVTTTIANPTLAGLLATLDFLFYRTFMIPNEALMEYFAAIPYVLDHTGGLSTGWIAALLGGEVREPTYWLVGEVHRGVVGSTTTAMFMADAWADFAWAGVVLVPLVAGWLVRWLDIRLVVREGKTAASIAGLSLGHYGIFVALSTAFQTALLTGGLLLIVPLVAWLTGPAAQPEDDVQPALPQP